MTRIDFRAFAATRMLATLAIALLAGCESCTTAIAGNDDGDDAKKSASSIPNIYLDLRTNYTRLPAGTVALGFRSFVPLSASLLALPSQATLPSSQSAALDIPLTVDASDSVSLYGGFTASTSRADTSPWTPFALTSWNVGVQADLFQQNGGSLPTITVQSTITRAIPQGPIVVTSITTIVEADYAFDEDETRGLLAGVQHTGAAVGGDIASIKPAFIGYLGAYYQWPNDWKVTGRAGVQTFGGAEIGGILQAKPFTGPVVRFDLDRMDDNDNRLFGVTAEVDWTPKPAFQITLRTPLYFVRQ